MYSARHRTIGQAIRRQPKIVEIPPGPPVIASLAAEIYGPPEADIDSLVAVSKRIRRYGKHGAVVDVDDFSEAPHDKVHFRLNRVPPCRALTLHKLQKRCVPLLRDKVSVLFISTVNASRWRSCCNYPRTAIIHTRFIGAAGKNRAR